MHIDFLNIKIQNFMSVGPEPLEIPFEKGIHFITGFNKDENSRNGVGKTTILSAVFFALYGELESKMLKSAIPHRFNEETCIIELNFSIGENTYRIIRSLRPSKVHLFINNEDKSKTSGDVNADIIKIIGNTSKEMFEKTIGMSANATIPFLAIPKKADKVEFIEGTLSLTHYSEMLDRARKLFNANDKSLAIEKSKNSTLLTQLEAHKNSYKQLEASKKIDIETLEKEKVTINQKIIELQKEIIINSDELNKNKKALSEKNDILSTDADKQIEELTNNISKLKERLLELDGELLVEIEKVENATKVFVEKLEKISEKETNARAIENKLNVERAELNTEIAALNKDIAKLDNTPTTCPTCKQKLADCDPQHLIDSKKQIEKERDEKQKGHLVIDQKFADFQTKYDKLLAIKAEVNDNIKKGNTQVSDLKIQSNNSKRTVQTDISKVEQDIQNVRATLRKQISDNNAEIQKIETVIASVVVKEKEIEKYTNTLSTKDEEIEKIKNKENPFKPIIIAAREDVAKSNAEVERLEEYEKVLNNVKFVVSPEGLKAFIIKKIIKLFNQRLDYYLKRLHSKYRCTFDEFFEETIIDNKGEIGYNNLSGGEKKRMDLAMLFTFRDIRKHQTGVTFNLSMYDEVFDSGLCSFGMNQVIDILQDNVNNFNECYYIVTHRKENCDYNNVKVLELVKENNCTHLVK